MRVAELEDAAVGGEQPVAAAVGGARHPDDRPVQRDVAGAPAELLVAEREDAAVGRDEAVAGDRHVRLAGAAAEGAVRTRPRCSSRDEQLARARRALSPVQPGAPFHPWYAIQRRPAGVGEDRAAARAEHAAVRREERGLRPRGTDRPGP